MGYSALIGDKDTVGSIKYLINYGRIDSVSILDEAQKFIYRKLRLPRMVKRADIAIALSAISAPLPDRYLDPIILSIPGYLPRVKHKDPERFNRDLGLDQDGERQIAMPTAWARIGDLMEFNHKSDAAYTGKFVFYQRPANLAADNETNWLTDEYPTLLRRVCMMYAFEERKEYDAMQNAAIQADAQVDEIKRDADLEMRGMALDFNWQDDED